MAPVSGQLFFIDGREEIVSFDRSTDQQFRITRFGEREEALQVFDLLSEKRYPAMSRVLPVTKIDGTDFYLPCGLTGSQLCHLNPNLFTLWLNQHGQQKQRTHRISPFYQDLLGTLFSVTHFILGKEIAWSYHMSDIYCSNGRISLMGFTRGKTTEEANFASLWGLIEQINTYCDYKADRNNEMKALISCLESLSLDPKKKTNGFEWKSLFYSRVELRDMICNVGEALIVHKALLDDANFTWPKSFTGALSQLVENPTIKTLVKKCEKYEAEKWRKRDQRESETIVDGFINDEACIAVSESESEKSGVMNEPVVDFTPVYLARKCICHFQKLKLYCTESEDDMVALFEEASPNFITAMVFLALRLKKVQENLVGKLLPRKTFLELISI